MFAQSFAADYSLQKYYTLRQDIKKSKFQLLDVAHHYTSGMKAVFTQNTMDGLIAIRQCLGGAGFTAWSGIPSIVEDYTPQVTFEGDNTVMAQ